MRFAHWLALTGFALAPIMRAEDAPLFAEAMARSRSLSQPQPEHRAFEPLVGHFKVELTGFSLSGKTTQLSGSAENQYVLGGRFLRSDWSAGEGDARLELTTYLGYDNAAKKYVMLALGTLSTSPLDVRGDYDATTRTFILSGKQHDELTGAGRMYRNMLKIESADSYELRSFVDLPGRAPFKMLQARFARQ